MDPLGRVPVEGIGDVDEQLAGFWSRASSEDRAVVRACTMNLIVACADGDDDLEQARRQLDKLSVAIPCRAVITTPSGTVKSGRGLDVEVSARCHLAGKGSMVCSEEITLHYDDACRDLVPVSVLQLLVEDLPVVTWWRRHDATGDGLLAGLTAASTCLLIDSADFPDPGLALKLLQRSVARHDWRGHGADVSWARVEPWREALASFFDVPARRPLLQRITEVTLTAGGSDASSVPSPPVLYLAGWLASRLGWRRAGRGEWLKPDGSGAKTVLARDPQFSAGEMASARIEAERNGSATAFVARRLAPDSELVLLTVEAGGDGPPPQTIELPARDAAALLCGTLQHAETDPVFAPALEAAVGLL